MWSVIVKHGLDYQTYYFADKSLVMESIKITYGKVALDKFKIIDNGNEIQVEHHDICVIIAKQLDERTILDRATHF